MKDYDTRSKPKISIYKILKITVTIGLNVFFSLHENKKEDSVKWFYSF